MNRANPRIPGMTAKTKGSLLGALLFSLASAQIVRQEVIPGLYRAASPEDLPAVVCRLAKSGIHTPQFEQGLFYIAPAVGTRTAVFRHQPQ